MRIFNRLVELEENMLVANQLTALWKFHATVMGAYWQGLDGPDMRVVVAGAQEDMNRELGGPIPTPSTTA